MNLEMDMNAIMKKLAARNQYQNLVSGGTFEQHNNRYSGGHGNHQPTMSFAGKKITTVSHNYNSDATKRLSMNLHSGFVNKVAQGNL
jgi:hypothetical protein